MGFDNSQQPGSAAGPHKDDAIEVITMPELLTRTAGRFPSRQALVFMGRKITYRELEGQVNRFAKALTGLGVQRGERVAMLMPNMPQLVIANYAAFRIGAIPAPLNPLLDEEGLTRRLNDSGASVLIALDLRFPLAAEMRGKTQVCSIVACHVTDFLPFPGNKIIKHLYKGLYLKVPAEAGIYEYLPLIEKQTDTPVENGARWDEAGALLHPEATTGDGKGVLMTHAEISSHCRRLRAALPDAKDGEESILGVFPFFQAVGWAMMQNLSILSGWTNILVPRPDPEVISEILRSYKPTLLPASPEIYSVLLDHEGFRKMDLSPVKAFLSCGTPLPPEVSEKLKSLKERPVVDLCGLTECGK